MDDVSIKLIEMKMIAAMFQSLSDACSAKCISKYTEGSLTTGEEACVERCSQKWMDTFKKVQTKVAGSAGQPVEAQPQQPEQKKGWF
ncbi:mitochondrial import inner membrane translocase subunit 10 [Tieghemostelium lacteum]|uniref:Mitochondrial import inner membrane translocase subunit n=1 Tax=Tieghemostelium lacteum TaxID=361077 RepID=A0A151ZJT6_TIELA|nr:mitochondrial import inner membrane translocase subunit 10 [Tieghemostelium lacteum]|eukprot:KYQ94262.1 mitochondrial import inner membrane translocase subunit 10 [Tieghemostelium lacteum]